MNLCFHVSLLLFGILLLPQVVISTITTAATCVTISTSQYNGLHELYNATQGTNWNWNPSSSAGVVWNFTTSPSQLPPNPCVAKWQGISCDSTKCKILKLSLVSYRLNGTLPSSISKLSFLTSLDLNTNVLVGTIPVSIGYLTALTYLRLDINGFTGSVPTSMVKLKSLTSLDLSENQLQGSIPNDMFTYMTALTSVHFDQNQLTGTIPSTLMTSCHSLRLLSLYQNYLNGSIPSTIGQLTSLTTLYLQINQLTGTIPSTLMTSCHNLRLLSLYHNFLNGSIPSTIGQLTLLTTLFLSYNQFTGTIPPTIGQLTLLTTLNLYNNSFTGTIPSTVGQLTSLTTLFLNYNQFTGTIPSTISKMKALISVYLSNNGFNGSLANINFTSLPSLKTLQVISNHFTGTLPENVTHWKSSLQVLQLNNNLLSGTIPFTYCQLTQLMTLIFSDNQFHGHLPTCIGNLTKLQGFAVDTNYFSGPYPESITNLVALTTADLSENAFTGTIPNDIGKLYLMEDLCMDTNRLTGTIPASVGAMTQLTRLWLHRNRLHGTIPTTIGQMVSLQTLQIYTNYLTGVIPNVFSSLQISLQGIKLSENNLHGSLPSSIANLPALQIFEASLNELTGPIPATIMQCTRLLSINIAHNLLTGPLPESFLQNKLIVIINSNFFTGLLSNTVYGLSWTYMKQLVVFDNFFTGDVKDLSTQGMTTLQALELQNNYFHGDINKVIYSATQKELAFIDLSNNAITGSISDNLFNLPVLTYLAVVKNCLTGSLPSNVCDRKDTLQILAMDGTHSASACDQNSIFFFSNAYVSSSAMEGSIPSCLFTDMKVLNTLHLSGNRLTGSLPDDIASISTALKNLSISHNTFTGTIPVLFQQNSWHELDLSFNKFTGSLHADFNSYPEANASVNLNQNRLSGKIPSSLQNIVNIDVLSGNIFQCEANREDLPQHDKNRDSYQCGSDEVNDSIATYLVTTAVLILAAGVLLIILRRGQQATQHTAGGRVENVKVMSYASSLLECAHYLLYPSKLPEYLAIFRDLVQIHHAICQRLVVFTSITASLLLIFYLSLGMSESSYQHRYAWQVSVAYLSGSAAAITLLLCFMLLLLALFSKLPNLLSLSFIFSPSPSSSFLATTSQILSLSNKNNLFPKHSKNNQIAATATDDNNKSVSSNIISFLHSNCVLISMVCVVVLTNMVVVFVVNGYYVSLVLSNISPSQASVLAFALSCFKTGWKTLLTYVFRSKQFKGLEIVLGSNLLNMIISGLCIFNSILVPCIATIFVNKNCFYYAVVQAGSVDTSFTFSYCSATETQYGIDTCISTDVNTFETIYNPAFSYSYLCSSSLLTTFASVWMYMFAINGLISPLSKIAALYLFTHHWKYVKPIAKWIPLQLRPVPEIQVRIMAVDSDETQLLNGLKKVARSMYDARQITINTVNSLAVILCFGLLFPPIAIAGCAAFIVQCVIEHFFIFRMVRLCQSIDPAVVETAASLQQRVELILEVIQDSWKSAVSMVHVQCVMLVGLVGIFWSFFLWDILGDEVGWKDSIWIAILLMAWTMFIYSLQQYHDRIFSYFLSHGNGTNAADGNNSKDAEVLEMQTVSPEDDCNIEVINPIAKVNIL